MPVSVGASTAFSSHHFHLQHGDVITSHIVAIDGAVRDSDEVPTNAFTVDLTPPSLQRLTLGEDALEDTVFQTSAAPLAVQWAFTDPESGVVAQHLVVGRQLAGQTAYVPSAQPVVLDADATSHTASVGAPLVSGAQYWFEVTAENGAGAIARGTSVRVTIDDTPPVITHLEVCGVCGIPLLASNLSLSIRHSSSFFVPLGLAVAGLMA